MAHRFSLHSSKAPVAAVESVEDVPLNMLPELPTRVTPAMVSEAAEAVLDVVQPQHADIVRRLWANDSSTDAARMLFQSQIAERASTNFVNWDRPVLRLNETLDAEQTAKCTAYAPEYQLVFRNSLKHDHPMFSASRVIDHQIILSKFPSGMPYGDIGGNVMFHVMRGDKNCVVIAPEADDKDPQRVALTTLRLAKIAAANTMDSNLETVSADSVAMARSILAGEERYVVRTRAENTVGVRVRATMSCHVYDIPMENWPIIMQSLGSAVHEGCVHFSNDFFEMDTGSLEFSGARFVIDRKRDTFSMGLGVSNANWYTHKWSDYMKYGANQILYGDRKVYAYQITERRGDTIFFRIMEVDGAAVPNRRQVYRLPTVERVEVHGFAVGQRRRASSVAGTLVPRMYVFPARLWATMLSYAKMESSRGGLDYNKMFNFYRTAVPRQTINATLVSGGEKVSLDEAPALIVMAAAVATADVLMLQQSADAVIGQVHKARDAIGELTILKALGTLLDVVKSMGYLAISPFAWLGQKIEAAHLSQIKASLVSWKPRVSICRFPVAVMADTSNFGYDYLPPSDVGFKGYLLGLPVDERMNVVERDPDMARQVLDLCGDRLPPAAVSKLREHAAPAAFDTAVTIAGADKQVLETAGTVVTAAPTYVTSLTQDQISQRRAHRRNAITEAVVESELEGQKLQAACTLWYRRLFAGALPNERAIRGYAEEMGNPDIWRVERGVFVESVLGQNPSDFQYSGVYTPVPDPSTGSHLRVVNDEMWTGTDRTSELVVSRRHFKLRDELYTGYALVLDELRIFNGPEKRESLRAALALPDEAFDTKIVVHQGPPGCGKTTSIVERFTYGTDIVLCPVRESLNDTRAKIRKRSPELSFQMLKNCTRTVDSYLVNRGTMGGKTFPVALGDECYITHPGNWYAVMALLGVEEFHGYGDEKQIKHVARVDAPQLYDRLVADAVEHTWITYRCAPEITAMWNGIYGERVRSAVKRQAVIQRLTDLSQVDLLHTRGGEPAYLVLTMYQADKKLVQSSMRGVDKSRVLTTHEAQGKAADQVILVNFEARVRTADDKFYLFFRPEYCNVALSRARYSFVYVKAARTSEMVTEMMDRAKDVKKVAKAKQIETAGE